MKSKIVRVLILSALALTLVTPLRADDRVIPPEIMKVWPAGMQRGTTATFKLDGRNLADIKNIIFDVPGISAKVTQVVDVPEGIIKIGESAPVPLGKKQSATIDVTVAKDVAPGLHWFRTQTPLGTSNLMPFDVGSFPEVHGDTAKAPGQLDSPPEHTTLPATLVGTIAAPGQVDNYEFDGTAGEELVFRVNASMLDSKLESLLKLRDDSGQVLAESGKYDNLPDAVLTYKLPRAGKYTLSVTDREEGGGMDHFYRVDAGPLPHITHVFPLGVRAGGPATVSVKGVNLGGLHEVTVDPPKESHGWTTMPLEVKTSAGWTLNKVKLAVGNAPEVLDQEPNNSPAQAQKVSLPVTINGYISGEAGDAGAPDQDYFRFHARKGEELTISVAAARLGSPLDSLIEVLDAEGKPIQRATLRCLNETAVTLSDKDSLVPRVRLLSTTGLHPLDYLMVGDELDQITEIPDQPDADVPLRGADDLRWAFLGTSPDVHPINTPAYRVEILPPDAEFPPNGLPVFHLTWRNDDGGPGYGADSRLNFVAPENADYLLHLMDVRGLEGPNYAYRVTIYDADPSFRLTAEPTNPNIPKGGSAYITVTANRVQGYDGPIDLSIEGLPAGITASHASIPAGQDSGVILLTAAVNAPVDAPAAPFKIVGHAKVNGVERTTVADKDSPLELASIIPPPDVTVSTDPNQVDLEPGRDVKVTLHVDRRNGFVGRVPCAVVNLPPGVLVVNSGLNGVLVPEGQSSRTFTLHAEDWAKPITQPIYVIAVVESNSPTAHPSAPLMVDVVGNRETASVNPVKEAGAPGEGSDAPPPSR